MYAKQEQQRALAGECRVFVEGVNEAKSMLRGTPYKEPKVEGTTGGERRAVLSALRCHQMIEYERLYQTANADDDFLSSLGLLTADEHGLVYDCDIYAQGFRIGDALLAMGVLR